MSAESTPEGSNRYLTARKFAGRLGCAALVSAVLLAQSAAGESFRVLHTFSGGADGANPYTTPLLYGEMLYGTTFAGNLSVPGAGYGTVFQFDLRSHGETVLHAFAGGSSDGAAPGAALVRDLAGNLYGTTDAGGAYNWGTVYEIDAAGATTVLHSFTGSLDGQPPISTLIGDGEGNFYGTTFNGGVAGCGTVFKVDSAGNLTTLYAFGGTPDGASPYASLLFANGYLYGTTVTGGAYNAGTIFVLNLATGKETVLYSFSGGTDGGSPFASVIKDGNGNLYGTTITGGNMFGVVYRFNVRTRQEKVLHAFSGSDGANPYAAVVRDLEGNLYGTTSAGGASGYGTVFQLDTIGNLTLLHTFTGGADGASPWAGLTRDSEGTLYGAALHGGAAPGMVGYGTLFKITQ